MKHFVHSKASQYRKLKSEWRQNVVLGRSNIQGLGLFANREIEPNSMVIEYIGSIIRNEVANRKEGIYESQNRGIYMFRIDTDAVIDATMAGGPARYINHSCMVRTIVSYFFLPDFLPPIPTPFPPSFLLHFVLPSFLPFSCFL